ncbi:MAG: GEVED domain-containing protein [Ferruginibacter sp.]
MCIKYTSIVLLLILSLSSFGQSSDFNSTFLVLNVNGSQTYYDLKATTANTDFQGANLGTFVIGTNTLVYNGAEHNIYKCGGCDFSSSRLYYRIYKTGTTPGSFVSNNVPYLSGTTNGCGGEDQQWKVTSGTTNLLSGLAPGNYSMEVYSDGTITCGTGTAFATNGGANYIATFKVTAPAASPVVVTSSGGTALASYGTLKLAFDAINAGTHTGVISISIDGNTTETASAVLNASGGTASYTSIAIQPTNGARTVSGNLAAPLLDFNGADNVTIDGLNADGNSLIISNTNTGATATTSTIRFITDATSNTITNCSVLGSSTMAVGTNGGTIYFAAGAATTGNDNNTISNCNIGPAGANLPTKAIYGNGSAGTLAVGNSGNSIINNNIYDAFNAGIQSAAVYLGAGNNTWSVTNNRIYQTATRTFTSGVNNSGIYISSTAATVGAQSYTITGNTIGYASSTQTGTYTLTGSAGLFTGIYYNANASSPSSTISSNTIASVSLSGVTSSGTSTSSPFIGILISEGNAVTNSNTIGSQSATGSLVFSTNTSTGMEVYGIFNFSSNAWTSNSNTVGGITVSNSGTGNLVLYAMRANTGSTVTWTAGSNTIGGTVANSIQNNSTSTSAQTFGMQSNNAPCVFTSNIVRNLTGVGGTGTGASASVIGISTGSATSANHTVSQNSIYALSNTNASAATSVTGINFGATSGTNLIARNFIHSLSVASTAGIINGFAVTSGTATYQNNMVRLGINAAGTDITTACSINGINETSGTNNFYFNSIYIGGTGVGTTASNTYAFQSTVTSNTRSYRNNIFMNVRSNATTGGKHYGIRVGGTTVNPTGLTSNYNDIYVAGTGTVFGYYNSADVASGTAWTTATGQDGASVNGDPQFIAPTGTSATVDLHIHATNPTIIEANGVLIASVTDDFDAQTRSGLTPTDIGADAGNFAAIAGTVTLGTNNIAAATINQGTVSNAIYSFSIAATGANTTLTALNITTTGTYLSADVTNLKVWYQSASTFNAGTATLLSTLTTPGVAGVKTFTPFTSQTITAGSTGYIFITADIPCAATSGNIIAVNAVTSSNTTFSAGTVSGTPAAGNTQTIGAVLPANVTGAAASVANASSSVSWTNPTGCYDEIMIVAATATNSGVPSGNGSAYTASLTFGSGTGLGNGFVVYKGTASPQTVTGLTNGTAYFYKIFTRFGTSWSSGVEVSATPTLTYCTAGSSASSVDEYISNVTLNTINNTSATAPASPYYTNFTAISTSLTQGSSYTMSVTNGGGKYAGDQCVVYFDWNPLNGVFTDASESFVLTQSGTTGVFSGTVTVPAGATLGSTRMRVRLMYTGTPSSCGNASYGEVEDYTVIIAAPSVPNCATYTSPANGATGICSPGSLNWTAPTTGGVPTGYKLYFGTDGAGVTNPTSIVNGTNIGNVLTYSFSGLTASTTYYWKIVPTNSVGDATGCTIQSFTTSASVAELVTPVSDDFESCPEWIFVNHSTNQWNIGTATGNPGKSIYISNTSGSTNAYGTGASQTSHFYRDITFPAGQTIYNFTFDLKSVGETGYDRLLVYIAPTSVTPVAGTPSSTSTTLTGATLLFTQANTTTYASWATVDLSAALTPAIVGNSAANSTMRIIFTWQNDASGGAQTPAAVDNVNITSSAPSPITIGTITAVQQTGNVYQNSVNNNIVRIDIPATGTLGTQTLTSVKVTSANINDADIATNGVTLWTGTAAAPTAQIGTAQTFAAGAVTFSGLSTSITAGTTYLWVRYDLPLTATAGNTVDARIAAGDIVITAAGGATAAGSQPVSLLDPAGSRPIVAAMCGSTYTINNTLPTSGLNYNNFTDAITDLNLRGISCAVVFNVKDGQTFNEYPPAITTTGTATNTITFQRDNSTGTRPVLAGTNGTGTTDAIIQLNGVDYLTWDGISLSENTTTNTTNTLRMEYGIYLKGAATDGCKNNTFKNFAISLTATNTNISKAVNTLSIATNSAGSNSNNKFYNLALSNATWGYSFDNSASSIYDDGNEVNTQAGGSSTISTIGNSASGAGYAVQIAYQTNFNLKNTAISSVSGGSSNAFAIYLSAGSLNTVNIESNTINGVTSPSSLALVRGIRVASSAASAITILNNNITGITGAGTDVSGISVATGTLTATGNVIGSASAPITGSYDGVSLYGINYAGSTAATITNNTISNLDVTGVSSSFYQGISCSSASSVITGNTLQNFTSKGASTSYSQYGIVASGASSSVNNNTINNISCSSDAYVIGIEISGNTTTANTNSITSVNNTGAGWVWAISIFGTGSQAKFNTVNNLSSSTGNTSGIVANGSSQNSEISNNIVKNLSVGSSASSKLSGAIAIFSTGTNYIRKNIVDNITNSSTTGAYSLGIRASGTGTTYIINNMISKVQANSSNNGTACAVRGITVESGATVMIYNNSVYLTGTATNASFEGAGLYASSAGSAGSLDMRNNIFYNAYGGTGKHAALYFTSSLANFITLLNASANNNLYYAGATPGTNNVILRVNTGGDRTTITDYKTAVSSKESNSFTAATVPFVNVATLPSDLHIDVTSTGLCAIADKGVAITSPIAVTDDIDADTRQTPPDVGADEFTLPDPVAGSIAASANPACEPGAVTITGSGQSAGADFYYQWQVNTGSGYTNLADAGVYTGTSTTTLTISNTTGLNGYLYRLVVNRCSPASKTINTNVITLTVNTASVAPVTLTATPNSVCSGTKVTLTQTGGSLGTGASWQWYTDASFTTTAGASTTDPNATTDVYPTANTTYYLRSINGTAPCATNVAATGSVNVAVSPSGQWTGAAGDNNWNTAGNWCGGVPTAATNVIIPAWATVNITSANAFANSVTIQGPATGAGLTMNNNYNLYISSGGSFNNSGTFTATASTGVVYFNGTGTVTGTTTFKNVVIAGAVDFGTGSTIGANGLLTINSGGSVNTNAPAYDCSSTLIYNTGGTYGRGSEWTTATSGRGYPGNVTVSASTTLNYNNGSTAARAICGSLSINAGSSLYMDFGGVNPTGALTVGGNVLLNGNMSLSNAVGGDLKIAGNWQRGASANFYPHNRAVEFNGTGTQTITRVGAASEDAYDYMIINKASGNVVLSSSPATSLILNYAASEVLQLLNGNLDLNGQSLTMNNTGGSIKVQGGVRTITGAAGSKIYINGDKSVVSASGGTLVTDVNVVIEANAGVDFGPNLSTVNGTLQLNAGSFVSTNAPYYGTSSLLKYNVNGTYDRRVEWSGTTSTAPGYPNDVLVTNNTILQPGGPGSPGTYTGVIFNTLRNLTIDAGSAVYMDATSKVMTVPLRVGGTLTISGALSASSVAPGDVYVGKDWVRNTGGVFNHNNRAVFFNTAQASTITASGGETFAYLYLDKDATANTVTTLDDVNITREIGITRGTYELATKNTTLRSDATNTASLGKITANSVISYGGIGRFIVERYVLNTGKWNLVGSPTAEAQTIAESWQNNYVSTAGRGTRITGPNANPAVNGLDDVTVGYSMKWWDAINNRYSMTQYTNNSSADSLVNRPTGFFLFVRGDRSVTSGSGGIPTTISSKGKLYVGTSGLGVLAPPAVSYTGLPAGRFISVANPYASAIDASSMTISGLNNGFYIWDPTISGNYGVGQYRAFNATSGWITTPTPASPSPYPSAGPYKAIQSGQAFFMEASGGNASLNFKEDDKISGSITFSRDPQVKMIMSTMLHSTNGNVADGNRVVFNEQYPSTVGTEDATKLMNSGENFGISTGGKTLIIEGRQPVAEADTIFYTMNNLRTQAYMLSFEPVNMDGVGLTAELIDKFLNTRTPVSLSDSSYYNFSTTSDAASKAAGRFMMVFRAVAGPLPVTFVNISAQRQADKSIKVNWEVANEVNIEKYEVQRSADGQNFSGILNADATNSSRYTKTDLSPLAADNFYRIKAIGIGGDITYSAIVKVAPDKEPGIIAVQSNPVKNKQVNVRFSRQPAGDYLLQLTNNLGQVVYKGSVTINNGSTVKTLTLHPNTTAGTYRLQVYSKSGETVHTEAIIVE